MEARRDEISRRIEEIGSGTVVGKRVEELVGAFTALAVVRSRKYQAESLFLGSP
jgi:hypothetical protein